MIPDTYTVTPTPDRVDYWVGRALDFLLGAGCTVAFIALGYFLNS